MQISNDSERAVDPVAKAREEFRAALIESHRTRANIGQVEAAAARFCRALRDQGQSPERTLIDAKKVIDSAIDGHDMAMAERAVTSCIQHYYRD